MGQREIVVTFMTTEHPYMSDSAWIDYIEDALDRVGIEIVVLDVTQEEV